MMCHTSATMLIPILKVAMAITTHNLVSLVLNNNMMTSFISSSAALVYVHSE